MIKINLSEMAINIVSRNGVKFACDNIFAAHAFCTNYVQSVRHKRTSFGVNCVHLVSTGRVSIVLN